VLVSSSSSPPTPVLKRGAFSPGVGGRASGATSSRTHGSYRPLLVPSSAVSGGGSSLMKRLGLCSTNDVSRMRLVWG